MMMMMMMMTVIIIITDIIDLTVSTPAPTTSIASPLTSSRVRSSFMSKYVNSGTTKVKIKVR